MRYPDYFVPCKYCNDHDWPDRYKHDPKHPSCGNLECRQKAKEEKEKVNLEVKAHPLGNFF